MTNPTSLPGSSPLTRMFLLLFLIILIAGCVKRVPPIHLTVPELLSHYQEYEGKRVLLKGEVSDKDAFGIYGVGFETWFFWLESGEKEIRCYEWHYRLGGDATANYIVLRARAELREEKPAEITVIGDLTRDGVELYLMEYKGVTVRTDLKEERFPFRPLGPWW